MQSGRRSSGILNEQHKVENTAFGKVAKGGAGDQMRKIGAIQTAIAG